MCPKCKFSIGRNELGATGTRRAVGTVKVSWKAMHVLQDPL